MNAPDTDGEVLAFRLDGLCEPWITVKSSPGTT